MGAYERLVETDSLKQNSDYYFFSPPLIADGVS
jgi:hypothetical protein